MKTSGNILRSHGRRAMLALVSLAALTFGSCADDDVTSGIDGDKGANVSFNVSQAQDNAQAAAKGMPVTRASFANELALQGLTFEDLPSQKLAVHGVRNTCIIETTTAGIDDNTFLNKHADATRANVMNSFGSAHFATIGYRGATAASISTTPWFYDKETKGDGIIVNAVPWRWAQPYGKFYGIYPRHADYNKLVLSPESYTSTPYVDFEVDPDVTKQADLMTACSGEVHYATKGIAPRTDLAFRHALTAVRFKVGQNLSWGKTISKVEIIGAMSKGRYTLSTEASGTGAAWSNLSTPTTFTLDGVSVSTSEAVNQVIMGKNNDNYTFYMIPQSLSGVSVKIHFSDGSTPITANLAGQWKPGTTKTYAISQNTSTWTYVLTTANPYSAANYDATSVWGYKVKSYRNDPVTNTQQPVKWKVVGYQESTDGGTTWSALSDTKPAWLTSLSPESGDGSTYDQYGSANIQKAPIIDHLAPYNKVLHDATPRGTAGSPYDLSIHDYKGNSTSMNTANCYLISAPGYYSIPLVYGNAIKGGTTNTTAYISSAPATMESGADMVLHTFKDHAGVDISSPYINVQNASDPATQADIVWTDQSGIVDGLSVTGSGNSSYVNFHVPVDKIRNGNAVISVKNAAGTIMWSWHLWFDHDDVLNTTPCVNRQGVTYNFTKQNLGFAWRKWEESTYTKPRVARLKVEQLASNGGVKQYAYIDITQNPGSVKDVSPTYYQQGRKDAMPGTNTIADGSYKKGGDNMSLTNGIQHPETFYSRGPSWKGLPPAGYSYRNLWSMNNTVNSFNDDPVVKTIYDPCPAGFHMPASNAFTGFSKSGWGGAPNASGTWDTGWNFNNKLTSPDATLFFLGAGHRSTAFEGSLSNVGNEGRYWTAIPGNTESGNYFYFDKTSASPTTQLHRSNGFTVRPVAE